HRVRKGGLGNGAGVVGERGVLDGVRAPSPAPPPGKPGERGSRMCLVLGRELTARVPAGGLARVESGGCRVNSMNKRDAARLLRKLQTPAEARLWAALRRNQLDRLHFRRQQPLGKFIADFYCDAARLAVEVDGDIHDLPDQAAWDADRDVAFAMMGITVLR